MTAPQIDAVTLEVMRNAFQSVAEEMGAALIRTALSTNIKDRMDCSTAIYNADGQLVAQAEHIPLHLGVMPSVVAEVLRIHSPETLQPGDAILINDPYISGSHLPDVFLLSPVFINDQLVAIVGNIAHHVDIGGMTPGSMSVEATEIFQEGVRIPAIHIRRNGVVQEEIIRLLAANVRTTDVFYGDIYAQLAANNIGEKRVLELFERYGVEKTTECLQAIIAYSERRMRAAISDVSDGEYSFEDYLEGDGVSDERITIRVTVHICKDNITVDFTGTSAQVKGPVNSTLGVTKACVYYAIKAMFDPDVPTNEGAFRAIHVQAPKATIVHPDFPAAVSNANINTSQRITDAILGALCAALPERSMAACSGTMNLFTIGGVDPRSGNYYSYFETYAGGQGAVNGLDGMDGVHTNMTNTQNAPAEVMEHAYPLLVSQYALANDSGGSGQYRGGMGLIREIVIESEEAAVTLSTERRETTPWGLFGGKNGKPSVCKLIHPDGVEEILPPKTTRWVQKNTRILLQTAGGGGYGLPENRDRDCVQVDVQHENVSTKTAQKDYDFRMK